MLHPGLRPLLVALAMAGLAGASEYRLVSSVRGQGVGVALGLYGDALVTTTDRGAAVLDPTTGAVRKSLDVPDMPCRPTALAVAGDTIAVGVACADGGIGAVYLFDARSGALQNTLRPTCADGAGFGRTLAASAHLLAVGAPDGPGPGAVQVVDLSCGGAVRTLTAPQKYPGDGFGRALAVAGSTVLVGAPFSGGPGQENGSAYLFDGRAGSLYRTFRSPTRGVDYGNEHIDAQFGSAVAFVGRRIAVGAPRGGPRGWGAVYVLDTSTGAIPTEYRNSCSGGDFGSVMLTTATEIAVGSPRFKSRGSVWVEHIDFARGIAFRSSFGYFRPSYGGDESGDFGAAIALGGGRLFIADPTAEPLPLGSGAVFVYVDATQCGNGVVDRSEVCDDGNTVSGDGCDDNCRPTGCGNGARDDREQCDDANDEPNDGCDPNCFYSLCGNGFRNSWEECDDGNIDDGDGCGRYCQEEPPPAVTTPDPPSITTPATPDTGPRCRTDASLCDDGNPCTRDTCGASGCEHVAAYGIEKSRCTLGALWQLAPRCDAGSVPESIVSRLSRARTLLAREGGRRERRRLARADRLLYQARTLANHAAAARHLDATCGRQIIAVIDDARVGAHRRDRALARRAEP